MKAVRLLDPPPGQAPRRSPGVAGVVGALATIAVLITVAVAATPAVHVEPSIPEAPLYAEYPRAVEVARSFVLALDRKDAAAAGTLLAPEAARVVLPAVPFRFVADPADPVVVQQALEFYVAVVDVHAGDCTLDAADLGGGAQVTCAVRIEGDFAAAGRVSGRTVPMVIAVDAGGVTDVLGGYAGAPLLSSYCWWVERTVGVEPIPLFDSECRPIPSAAAAARHRELAADYLARIEATRTGRRYRITRSWVRSAELLVDVHNAGAAVGSLIEAEAPVARAPGLLGTAGTPPALVDFLTWSGIAYEIERGTCSVDGTAATAVFRLVCPQASWHGPLIAGLGFDWIEQPASFVVSDATVLGIEGDTAPALLSSFTDFCTWVWDEQPHAAANVFSAASCTPIYTADAARRLLMVLSGYPGPR